MEFQILKYIKKSILLFSLAGMLTACEKEITVDLPPSKKFMVVEAYVNDTFPWMNYCILSQTVDYFNPSLEIPGIGGALVFVTEGEKVGNDTIWDLSSKTQWIEISLDSIRGLYFNSNGEVGKRGKLYKMEIDVNGQNFTAVTSIPEKVYLDSLYFDWRFKNRSGNPDTFAFLKSYFTDPAGMGNNYRAMYFVGADTLALTWGDIRTSDGIFDDSRNDGMQWVLEYGREFRIQDTLSYYLISIDRPSFFFWDSYFTVRNNGGPFATPAQMSTNFSGPDVIGAFSGFAVDFKRRILQRP